MLSKYGGATKCIRQVHRRAEEAEADVEWDEESETGSAEEGELV